MKTKEEKQAQLNNEIDVLKSVFGIILWGVVFWFANEYSFISKNFDFLGIMSVVAMLYYLQNCTRKILFG